MKPDFHEIALQAAARTDLESIPLSSLISISRSRMALEIFSGANLPQPETHSRLPPLFRREAVNAGILGDIVSP